MDFEVNVIIPASGKGSRFGGDIPKQFVEINGEPILKHTIRIFENCEFVNNIIVTADPEYIPVIMDFGFSKIRHIIQGGTSRGESVYNALQTISPFDGVVLIHDGIRLFISKEKISEVAITAYESGAAVIGYPTTDTIKIADEKKRVIDTPDRSVLWQVQTPQGFRYNIIRKAYETAGDFLNTATDDSQLVEKTGQKVSLVLGDKNNIKITTPFDLMVGEYIFERIYNQ